jgi:hypothetical protein
MKKILSFVFVLLTIASFAQKPTFKKNNQAINLGLGLGSSEYIGSYYNTIVPPISVSYELGIIDNFLNDAVIGVGGYIGFGSYEFIDVDKTKFSTVFMGARGTFHYPFVDNIDTYGGLMLGYQVRKSIDEEHYSPFDPALFVGARYYFTPEFSAMAEAGWGFYLLNIGLAYKF